MATTGFVVLPLVVSIPAGEVREFKALEYLTISSCSAALEIAAAGSENFAPFTLRQVYGDGESIIGPVRIRNPQGTTTTAVIVTSNRGISWNETGSATNVNITGSVSLPVTSTQLPATLGQKVAALSTSVVLASDQGAIQVLGGTLANNAVNSTVLMSGVSDGVNARRLLSDATGAVNIGNPAKRTYTIAIRGIPATTANYVVFTINAAAGATTRIRSIRVVNPGSMTAAQLTQFEIIRTTAAATLGTVVTPSPCDVADAAFGGVVRTLGPTITAGTSISVQDIWVPAAAGPFSTVELTTENNISKDLSIAPGTANGLALRIVNGAGGAAGMSIVVQVTEE